MRAVDETQTEESAVTRQEVIVVKERAHRRKYIIPERTVEQQEQERDAVLRAYAGLRGIDEETARGHLQFVVDGLGEEEPRALDALVKLALRLRERRDHAEY